MLLAAGVITIGVWLSPPPPEAVRRAIDAVYADARIQRTLPGAPLPEAEASPENGPPRTPRRAPSRPSGGAASGVSTVLLWALVFVVAAVVVAAIVQGVATRRREGGVAAVPAVRSRADGLAEAAPPGDAEALAAAGRFDEAVHALLLRAVQGLRVDGRPVPPTWTSRETWAGATLAAPDQGAFGVLVDAVERSLFGGRPLGPGDWRSAREAFARLDARQTSPS